MSYIRKLLDSLRRLVFPRLRILEQELAASRAAQAAAAAELVRVREDLQLTREQDAQQIAGLRERVQAVDTERRAARDRVERLEYSLAEAERHRKATAERISALEARLEEEHSRHEASTLAAQAGLARLQEGQQSLLAQQGELTSAIQQAATGLLETLRAAREKPAFPRLQLLLLSAVLFGSGLLFGVYTRYRTQDSGPQLAAMQQDVRAMSADIKRHLENQEELLRGLVQTLDRLGTDEQASLGGEVPQPGIRRPAGAESQADIRTLQLDLMALGFDLGSTQPSGELDPGTRLALQEFRRLYLPQDDPAGGLPGAAMTALIREAAGLARGDATRYRAGREVLGAIRLGSIRTGVDFSILMDLARVESSYNPQAQARESSAAGLFQFKEESWLEAVRRYGARFGLQDYAAGLKRMEAGGQDATDTHDRLRDEVLALRFDPRLAALLAAENIKRNLRYLSRKTRREPGRTELYLLHFLGLSGAARFLEALDAEPAAIAGEIFPEAAARNRGVFQNRQREPRTVAEVYRWLDGRFNAARNQARDPG